MIKKFLLVAVAGIVLALIYGHVTNDVADVAKESTPAETTSSVSSEAVSSAASSTEAVETVVVTESAPK